MQQKEHNTKYEKTARYENGFCCNKLTESKSVNYHFKTVHGYQMYTKCKHHTQIFGQISVVINMKLILTVTSQMLQKKLKAKIEQQKAKHAIANFFQSLRIQAGNQIDVFNFVSEILADLKWSVRKKIAELAPLKVHLSLFVKILKPRDETKVGGHAKTKSINFNNRTDR